MQRLPFWKYQGCGNDFIVFDGRKETIVTDKAHIIRWCDRRLGIGADGILILAPPTRLNTDFHMFYFNSDGNVSTFCGNGARCIVQFARHQGLITADKQVHFSASDGLHTATILADEIISLVMQPPTALRALDNTTYFVDTGSPHQVIISEKPLTDFPVVAQGRQLRHRTEFAGIGGTNVNFAYLSDQQRVQVRTYERGVEDETLSCGTGAVAVGWCLHHFLQYNFPIRLDFPGGVLTVDINDQGLPLLIGPAVAVFEGRIKIN